MSTLATIEHLRRPFDLDFSGWKPAKLRPGITRGAVRVVFRVEEGETMGRRKKGRIPKLHRLETGRWHRDAWFSVARAGAWCLRVHHKRGGWRAHVRCGSWRLCDLPAPVATRAGAERAILAAAEQLCAGVQTALDAPCQQLLPGTFPEPPATDPGWRNGQGERAALAGARMRLAEVTAALEALRGDVEAPPGPASVKDHPTLSAAGAREEGA